MVNRELFLYGDCHGQLSSLMAEIQKAGVENADIIQLGDFGLHIFLDAEGTLDILNEFMKERDIMLYTIRGNHDNPHFWNGENKLNRSHVKFMSDYKVDRVGERTILFIGGAVSIDRMPRIRDGEENLGWWKDEVIRYDERDRAFIEILEGVDMVITHTAPESVYPYTFNNLVKEFSRNDPGLEKDLKEERGLLSSIRETLAKNNTITTWAYGHFHEHHLEEISGTLYLTLSENELYWLR